MYNQEIKILLSIKLQGGTLLRSGDSETIKWYITKQDVSKQKLPESVGKQIIKSGKCTRFPLITKESILKVKITQYTYDFYTSSQCPDKHLIKQWKKMTPTQRLEWHLQKTCEHFKGISYSYEIMED